MNTDDPNNEIAGGEPSVVNGDTGQNPSSRPAWDRENTTPAKKPLAKIAVGVVIALVAVLLVYLALTYLIKPLPEPINVRISNVTDHSASISWVTNEPSQGAVLYSDSDEYLPGILSRIGKDTAYDDRDVSAAKLETASHENENLGETDGAEINYESIDEDVEVKNKGEYYVHHVTLEGLESEKTYYIRVGNGTKFTTVTVDADDGGSGDNTVRTVSELEDMVTPSPSYGFVKLWGDEEKPVEDGIMYMTLKMGTKQSFLASAPLAKNGSWIIDLNNIRTENGSLFLGGLSQIEYDRVLEELEIEAGEYGRYSKEISTTNDAPAEDILVMDPELEINQREVDRLDDTVNPGTEDSLLVSHIYAFDCGGGDRVNCSVCKGGSTRPQCEQGCTYNGEGVQISCGFMAYCQKDHCSNDPPNCECGCQNGDWHCNEGYRCKDHKCILDVEPEQEDPEIPPGATPAPAYEGCQDGWGPECCGAAGDPSEGGECINRNDEKCDGELFNNKCPGGQNIKCCLGGSSKLGEIMTGACDGKPDGQYRFPETGTIYWCCSETYMIGVSGCPEAATTWCPPSFYVGYADCMASDCEIDDDNKCIKSKDSKLNDCWWCRGVFAEEPRQDMPTPVAATSCDGLEDGGPYVYKSPSGISNFFYCCDGDVNRGASCDGYAKMNYGCFGSDYKSDLGTCSGGSLLRCHPEKGYQCSADQIGRCMWKESNTCGPMAKPPQPASYDEMKDAASPHGATLWNTTAQWTNHGTEILDTTYDTLTYGLGVQDLKTRDSGDNLFVVLEQGTGGGLADCGGHKIILSMGNVQYYTSSPGELELGGFEGTIIHETMHTVDRQQGDLSTQDEWIEATGWTETGSGWNHECIQITNKHEHYCDSRETEVLPTPKGKTGGDVSTNPAEDFAESARHFLQNNDALSESSPSRCKYMREQFPGLKNHPCFDCNTGTVSEDGCRIQDLDIGPEGRKETIIGRSVEIPGKNDGLNDRLPDDSLPDDEFISKPYLDRGIISQLYAADETSADSILILPKNGLFAIGNSGIYTLKIADETYYVHIPESGAYGVYLDINGDDLYTEDIDILITENIDYAGELGLSPHASSNTYKIYKGYNSLSFDTINQEVGSMASEILKYLNQQYGDNFFSIATLESGNWQIVANRDGAPYGAGDFQVIPGRGYMLKSKDNIDIEWVGSRVSSPVPVFLREGWNLMAVHGSTTDYKATGLIRSIDEVGGLDADNISQWNASRSLYEGLQMEPDAGGEEQVYGFDYPIDPLGGYFVRVVEGEGMWEPE